MPVYKQYRYYKIRDCPGCRYFKFDECHHPAPNDFNCHFITQKEWKGKWFFRVQYKGRIFVKRGYLSQEDAERAEMEFRDKIFNPTDFRAWMPRKSLPTYRALMKIYSDHLKRYKISSYKYFRLRIQNYYSSLFP